MWACAARAGLWHCAGCELLCFLLLGSRGWVACCVVGWEGGEHKGLLCLLHRRCPQSGISAQAQRHRRRDAKIEAETRALTAPIKPSGDDAVPKREAMALAYFAVKTTAIKANKGKTPPLNQSQDNDNNNKIEPAGSDSLNGEAPVTCTDSTYAQYSPA